MQLVRYQSLCFSPPNNTSQTHCHTCTHSCRMIWCKFTASLKKKVMFSFWVRMPISLKSKGPKHEDWNLTCRLSHNAHNTFSFSPPPNHTKKKKKKIVGKDVDLIDSFADSLCKVFTLVTTPLWRGVWQWIVPKVYPLKELPVLYGPWS